MKKLNFSRIREIYRLPHLLSHQMKSFGEFLQADIPPERRRKIGLQKVFKEIFPIESLDKTYKLEYISYFLGRPKYSIEECKRRGLTFAAPLRVRLRLIGPEEAKDQEL